MGRHGLGVTATVVRMLVAWIAMLTGLGMLAAQPNRTPTPEPTPDGDLRATVIATIERLTDGRTVAVLCHTLDDAEVVEVDAARAVRWRSAPELGLKWAHSCQYLAATDTFLISDTGNNRVIEIDRRSKIVWEYTNVGLIYPNYAQRLPNGNTLITVRDADLVLEVTADRKAVWHFDGTRGPHGATRLANGHTLVANSSRDRVVEVNAAGQTVWECFKMRPPLDHDRPANWDDSAGPATFKWPRSAERLGNGHTLIADTGYSRIVEIDADGRLVWFAAGLPMVYDAHRLDNGHTLATCNQHPVASVVEFDATGAVVWEWLVPQSRTENAGIALQPSHSAAAFRRDVLKRFTAAREANLDFSVLAPALAAVGHADEAVRRGDSPTELAELAVALDTLDDACSPGRPRQPLVATVVDASGAAVPGAVVMVVGTRKLATTDATGRVTIPAVRPDAIVAVRAAGFAEHHVKWPGGAALTVPLIRDSEATAWRGDVAVLTMAWLERGTDGGEESAAAVDVKAALEAVAQRAVLWTSRVMIVAADDTPANATALTKGLGNVAANDRIAWPLSAPGPSGKSVVRAVMVSVRVALAGAPEPATLAFDVEWPAGALARAVFVSHPAWLAAPINRDAPRLAVTLTPK